MFFDEDYKKKRNINLGNRNLSSKDDFMKKLKETEKKQKEENKINQSNIIIKSFLRKNFTSRKKFSNSNVYENLLSIKLFIEENNFDQKKKN